MMYTGGTTGPPKGAVLTQANVVCHMKQMRTWTGFNNIGEHTIASAFPLFHQAGNFLSLWAIAYGGLGDSPDQSSRSEIHVQSHEEIETHGAH